MRRFGIGLISVLVFLCPDAALGQPIPPEIVAVRATKPLALDSAPTDAAWAPGALPGSRNFISLTRQARAPMQTQAYLLYDDQNLYVAFHCEQPDQPIVATQTTNDLGFGLDDFVGIGIDTSGNASQVYFFEATPHGVRYQQASESNRYRPAWSAVGSVANGSWNSVMTIPLAALKYHAGPKTSWRINVFRSVSAINERLTWAYNGLMHDSAVGDGWPAPTDARFWPRLTGLHFAAVRTARIPSADFYGLGSIGSDHNIFVAPDGLLETEPARTFGLDISYPLTDTTTLVATANPDFSNIEVDQQTIEPQEFSRQLKEYRPFFAQGASYIEANPYPPGSYVAPGDLLFYTPNVGPFDRGAKIEGTNGNQSFGVMSFRGYDELNTTVFDDTAFGYHHVLPDRTFQYWLDGVLAHHSDAADETTEFGLGGRNNTSGFVWQADDALEHRVDAQLADEHSFNAFVDIHKPNYELNATYRDVSPSYGPIDGFTATADLHGPSAAVNFNGAAWGLKNVALQLYGDRYFDASGAVHQADTFAYLTAVFRNGWSIDSLGPGTGVLRSYDIVGGANCTGAVIGRSGYSGAPCYRNGQTDRFNLFSAAIGYREGTSMPAAFSYAQGPFGPAYVHQFSATTSRPLGSRLSLALEYDGTNEHANSDGQVDSQWLRRISLGMALGADENVTLSLRAINGNGGYAVPGVNLAAGYHRRYANGNDFYADFGTAAAPQTLHRVIVKYVLHLGPLRS